MEPTKAKARQAQLESDRQNIQSTWDVIEKFVVPYRGDFFRDQTGESEVDWSQRDIYDTTAVLANQTLASSIHGALTNPSYRWFDLRFRKRELNADNDAARWLEEVGSTIYYMLQESNFNLEISETYVDICSFGTAIQLFETTGKGSDIELVFKSIPLKECFFETDHRGQVCNFYRKLRMTPIQMAAKFGKDKLPTCVLEKLEGNSANISMSVLFYIYKREIGAEGEIDGPLAPSMRPFQYRYILLDTCDEMGSGGYYEMPAFAARWRKTSESVWGNSPAMIALPDILTANQLVELILRSAEKVVDPATLTTERGLLSDLDLEPGGLTIVRSLDEMKAYESKARFDVSDLQHNRLQQNIRDTFHVNELQLKDSPAMTATEVQVRYELMQRLLGPTAGRIQNDLLNPIINRAFLILEREGLLPERPESLQDVQDIDIQYTGPLARAQKSDTALATERWIQGLAALAEVYPDIMRIPDFDAIARGQAMNLNVPAEYQRPKAAIDAEKRAEAKAMEQQQQIDQIKQAGDAAQSVGKGVQMMNGNADGQ